MIEGLSGTSYLKCKASETSDPMACVIYRILSFLFLSSKFKFKCHIEKKKTEKGLDQLFGDIAAVCVTGECTATPRPAIEVQYQN